MRGSVCEHGMPSIGRFLSNRPVIPPWKYTNLSSYFSGIYIYTRFILRSEYWKRLIVRLHIYGDNIAAIGACDEYNEEIMQKKSEEKETFETYQTLK